MPTTRRVKAVHVFEIPAMKAAIFVPKLPTQDSWVILMVWFMIDRLFRFQLTLISGFTHNL